MSGAGVDVSLRLHLFFSFYLCVSLSPSDPVVSPPRFVLPFARSLASDNDEPFKRAAVLILSHQISARPFLTSHSIDDNLRARNVRCSICA